MGELTEFYPFVVPPRATSLKLLMGKGRGACFSSFSHSLDSVTLHFAQSLDGGVRSYLHAVLSGY